MSFLIRAFALAWLFFGGWGSLMAGPFDYAWSVALLMLVIAPVVGLFWLASIVASARRVSEMEKAIRRSKGEWQ